MLVFSLNEAETTRGAEKAAMLPSAAFCRKVRRELILDGLFPCCWAIGSEYRSRLVAHSARDFADK